MSYGFLIYSRKKVVPMERIGISLRSTFFINDEFLTDFDFMLLEKQVHGFLKFIILLPMMNFIFDLTGLKTCQVRKQLDTISPMEI